MFSDENFMLVVGALECMCFTPSPTLLTLPPSLLDCTDDPELPFVKMRHRNFLQNTAAFKEVRTTPLIIFLSQFLISGLPPKQVVPIRNRPIVQRIHHTFRVQYLKDVVLPRLLDDLTFATINSIIFFNNVEIAESLYSDKRFMTELYVFSFIYPPRIN